MTTGIIDTGVATVVKDSTETAHCRFTLDLIQVVFSNFYLEFDISLDHIAFFCVFFSQYEQCSRKYQTCPLGLVVPPGGSM